MKWYHVLPRVYISRNMPFPAIDLIKKECDTSIYRGENTVPREELLRQVTDKVALFCLVSDKIDRELIDRAPNLKIISTMSAGFEHIDVPYATARGIYVCYAPDALTEATADLAFALLLSAARRVAEGDRFMRRREWTLSWAPLFFAGKPVWGCTLGIIGLGKIGKAMARRASGFNMKVLYNSRTRLDTEEENNLGVSYVTLDELLEKSDFVSVHVPATDTTRRFLNEERFKKMKSSPLLLC